MGPLEVEWSLWKCQEPSRSAKGHLEVPTAPVTCQRPSGGCQGPSGSAKRTSGSAKIPLEVPKAIWKCQEPPGSAKDHLEVPRALRKCQKPSGSAKIPLEAPKTIWKCQVPSGSGKTFPSFQGPAFSLRASSGLGGTREAQTITLRIVSPKRGDHLGQELPRLIIDTCC